MFDISTVEKRGIINAINYIIINLNDELSTRTGFTFDEYQNLLQILNNNTLNNYKFNKTQLQMIHQAFNEILNGLFIENFEKEIGLNLNDARKTFVAVENIIDRM